MILFFFIERAFENLANVCISVLKKGYITYMKNFNNVKRKKKHGF